MKIIQKFEFLAVNLKQNNGILEHTIRTNNFDVKETEIFSSQIRNK